MCIVLTSGKDVKLVVSGFDVEDLISIVDLLPDGEGESVGAVGRVQNAIVEFFLAQQKEFLRSSRSFHPFLFL